MRYDYFMYLTPPRAEDRIAPALLSFYEKQGWLAQIKKNGTNSVIFVSPEKKLTAMNRHGDVHRQWSFTKNSAEPFLCLPGKGWWVVNAELLHAKTPNIKDTNYIHDVLVADGEWMIGEEYSKRYKILEEVFKGAPDGDHLTINANTWLASNISDKFRSTFDSLKKIEDEGLVLKDPKGPVGW